MSRRILVRAHKHPYTVSNAERSLAKNSFGSNVGNLVFGQAVIRLLSIDGRRIPTSGLIGQRAAKINAEYDHVVIPLANAFRSSYVPSLEGLSKVIEKLTVPVTVLGVGAQASLEGRDKGADRSAPAITRFVRAVLDRSPSIGVRGEFTRDYLAGLGFGDEHVQVIGCPSMFMYGPDLPAARRVDRLTTQSPVALNISPYVHEMGPVSHDLAARYPNVVYIPQDLRSLHLLLRGSYPMTSKRVTVESGVPITLQHPLIRSDRVRFCLDPVTWFDHLAGYDFSLGTRIHGNIAAVLAGTPALVLAHDSRTLELAGYHAIPHRVIKELPQVDPVELYEEAEWDTMAARHPALWQNFARFLESHGLVHAYCEGHSAEQFDTGLAAISFPPPVHTLMGEKPEKLYAMKRELQATKRQLARYRDRSLSKRLERAREDLADWVRRR